eukprot:2641768-Rhodomonas_salina.1
MALAFHLGNTVMIELAHTRAAGIMIFVAMLVTTASLGPSMLIWILLGWLLSNCHHRGRVKFARITEHYYPRDDKPGDIPGLRLVYKLKCARSKTL